MARNTVDTKALVGEALDFYETLSDEARESLPADTDPKWFDAVVEAMRVAAGTDEKGEKARAEATPVHYTVIVLYTDGTHEVVGSAFAKRGRGESDLTKLETLANVSAAKMERRSHGRISGDVLRVESSSIPNLLRSSEAQAAE